MTVRRSVGFVKAIRVTTQREKQMETKLPERINVMKVISYDVQQVVNEMSDPANGWVNGLTNTIPEPHEITTEMIMEYIEGWIEQDFPADRLKDLIIQDQDGEEL
jgi:hypothetical protein